MENAMPKTTFFNLPEEKRRLILDLAIEEFAERDYKSASISNIVAGRALLRAACTSISKTSAIYTFT
jgi:AcrR family transcriptional regulator